MVHRCTCRLRAPSAVSALPDCFLSCHCVLSLHKGAPVRYPCWLHGTGIDHYVCCLQAAVAKSDMGFFGTLPMSAASAELGSNKRKSKELGSLLAHAETQHVCSIPSCCPAVAPDRALAEMHQAQVMHIAACLALQNFC